jgi:aryl-alcohol dehydrogenase-like predicted oxidoreductase
LRQVEFFVAVAEERNFTRAESYSMLNRWIETEGLLGAAADEGFGVIGFTALAQGLLTSRYLAG